LAAIPVLAFADGPDPLSLDLTPGWASLTAHGNSTQLYRYRSLSEGWFADALAFKLDAGLAADGYWRDLGARDQVGFVQLSPARSGGIVRFSADEFRYFADPTVLTAPDSEQTSRRFDAYLPVADAGFRLIVIDRRVEEPDFVRLRPSPGLDYRTLTYDAALAQPLGRGAVKLGLRSEGFDDTTGLLPTSQLRDVSASVNQSLGRVAGGLYYDDARIDQDGLGSASVRRWRMKANWVLAPRLTWSATGQLGRASFPFTQTRYAPNQDRLSTRVIWRPGRWVMEARYSYRAWELYAPALAFVQATSGNEVGGTARYRDGRLGELSLRYQNSRLRHPPFTLISELTETATLYYDRSQAFSANWSRPLGELGTAYAGFAWSEKRHTERGFTLRAKCANAGVSAQLTPSVSLSLDYLWDSWRGNVSPFDPLGFNNGDDGELNPDSPDRPLFSDAQTLTIGVNLALPSQTWASITLSGNRNTGGARANTAFLGAELSRQLGRDWSIGIGYEREVFADDYVRLYNYDYSIVRLTLSGRFGGR
jgi:hypothetical protein